MMRKGIGIVAALMITATGLFAFKSTDIEDNSMEVTYEVNCKECDVSFRNEKGESSQVLNVQGNWTYNFNGAQGQFIYVSATNPDGSEVVVNIKRGGKIVIVGTSNVAEKTARAGIIL